jgi:hypothetical protein
MFSRMRNLQRALILIAICCCGTLRALQQTPESQSKPSTASPPTDKDRFHIYLLMGQSNMVGRDTRNLDSQTGDPRILSLNGAGQWVIAHDPLHEDSRIKPGVGPGLWFAMEMIKTDPNIVIGLVPCAVGGTPLRRWVKGGDLYEKAVQRAKLAAQSGVLSGVLWHQGEADTNKLEDAETYEVRLTQMFMDLRSDLGQPNLPVVVGQLGDFLSLTPEKYPFLDKVRTAIKHVPGVLPNSGYADSAGLTDKGDKLHFSAEAQKEFGVRYAKAMKALQKPESP